LLEQEKGGAEETEEGGAEKNTTTGSRRRARRISCMEGERVSRNDKQTALSKEPVKKDMPGKKSEKAVKKIKAREGAGGQYHRPETDEVRLSVVASKKTRERRENSIREKE